MNIKSHTMHHMVATIDERNKDFEWDFVDFYGDLIIDYRGKFQYLLKHIIHNASVVVLVMGDFNEILLPIEKTGGMCHPPKQIVDFRNVIDACGLVDLGFHGYQFMWC